MDTSFIRQNRNGYLFIKPDIQEINQLTVTNSSIIEYNFRHKYLLRLMVKDEIIGMRRL